MNVEPIFKTKHRIRRVKRQFDYESRDDRISESPQKQFEIEFFNPLVDTLIVSIEERFAQFYEHTIFWDFLYNIKKLPDKEELLQKCKNLEESLTFHSQSDINGEDLCNELISIKDFFKHIEDVSPLNILNCISENNILDLYPTVWAAYRILLTKPITVATGERSFSKLKLIKTYLSSTISEERLNCLALLSIENDIARNLDFHMIIKTFANIKARKINFFK